MMSDAPLKGDTTGPLPDAHTGPPRKARWVLFVVLFIIYMPFQLVLGLLAVGYLRLTGRLDAMPDWDVFLFTETGIWVTVLAAMAAALITIAAALGWPRFWRRLAGSLYGGLDGWLAWRKPLRIRLWHVPAITLLFLLLVSGGVQVLIGPAEVEAQLFLFSSTGLQIASTLIVSTVVPVAEEFLFRGALYNALLVPAWADIRDWRRHLMPFVITSLLFALLHLPTGFETAASIVLITLFSMYLSALRAVTDSVQASVTAHLVWNVVAALALTFANLTV